MHQGSSEQAAQFLRLAVPLMVKHSIPPTPYNYALWYSYVSKRSLPLNKALDQTLETYGTCPESFTRELFRDHVIPEEVGLAEHSRQAVNAVVDELKQQTGDAHSDALHYGDILSTARKELPHCDLDEMQQLMIRLSEGTQKVSDSNRQFLAQIESAQKKITALKEDLKKARSEVDRDPLTGLYNRRVFEQYLATPGGQQRRCLVMVDIDHFKRFNDNYGHNIGDLVLRQVGALLQQQVGERELAVRFGGEEFVLLLCGPAASFAVRAEKIRIKIQELVLLSKRDHKPLQRITASFGVAIEQGGEERQEWLERADALLYQAKNSGRNRIACCTDQSTSAAVISIQPSA
tara:strand:- start:7563 stop:8606 length:1044 start_codon:yes stop_codon:yes gene_type:complete